MFDLMYLFYDNGNFPQNHSSFRSLWVKQCGNHAAAASVLLPFSPCLNIIINIKLLLLSFFLFIFYSAGNKHLLVVFL